MWFFLIIIIILAILVFWAVAIFNHLVTLKNQVKNAWSQIDVQLRRRYDLIPNLVESVKGYMGHEKGTLEGVVKARNQAIAARESIEKQGGPTESSLKQLIGAETALQGALANVFALSESYPELRASENMKVLQEELSSTENRVAFSRQGYNDQVLRYNTYQQKFPALILAQTFGHQSADLYEVGEAEAKEPVKVSF